jgi:hypothetical protein
VSRKYEAAFIACCREDDGEELSLSDALAGHAFKDLRAGSDVLVERGIYCGLGFCLLLVNWM